MVAAVVVVEEEDVLALWLYYSLLSFHLLMKTIGVFHLKSFALVVLILWPTYHPCIN